MDNLHYRLTFDLGKIFISKSILLKRAELLKISKIAKFGTKMRNVVKCGKYSLAKLANFVYFCITHGNSYTTFGLN